MHTIDRLWSIRTVNVQHNDQTPSEHRGMGVHVSQDSRVVSLPCVKMKRIWSLFDGNRGNQRFSNTLKKHFPGEPCTEKWQGIKVQASRKVGKQNKFRITSIPPSGWGVRWRIIAFCKGTVRAPSRKMMPKRWKIIQNHEKSRFFKSLKIKS